MNEYSICTDVYEIAAGTRNKLSPVFREAAENIDNATPKGFGYIKNFIISIEELSKKDAVKDSRISSSNGNIKNFKGYSDIESALSFLNKYLKDIPTVKECSTVLDALEKYQPLYTEAYDKKVRLLVLEYENAVYLLVTTLSMLLANNMDVTSNGSEIRIQKKSATTFGVIPKTLSKLAKELGDRSHKEYLETMLKRSADADDIEESAYTEGVVSETLTLISAILTNAGKLGANIKHIVTGVKKSLFGIIPLIRAIIFLRYKKKADTIVSLEDQIIFIKQNIEQLQNRKNIDPEKKAEIIKKQMAIAEAYRKKAEKLRAELCEQEKDASVEIKKDDTNIKDMDDDYVLEYVMLEKAYKMNRKLHKTKKKANRTKSEVLEIRKDVLSDNNRFKSIVKKDNTNIKDLDAKLEKAAQKLFNDTATDAIRLKPGKNYKTDDLKRLTDTKIGGIPYWPKNMEWPTIKNAKGETKPMICIAQLNLDKLPKLKGYPTSGLLQFFYYEVWNNGNWGSKVVYHKKYDSKDVLTEVPDSTINGDADSPIIGLYYPTAEIIKSGIGFFNEVDEDGNKARFSDYETEYINKALGTNYKRADIPYAIARKFFDFYFSILKDTGNNFGCKIGGWPAFVQSDFRDKNHGYLLLQLDSEDGMMWGDCGNAQYMISKNNLKSKKFDDVLFDWQCC